MKKTLTHLKKDPVMAGLIEQFPNVYKEWEKNQKQKRDVFVSISRTITGQQLSVKAASTIWGRVEKLIGKVTPENVLKNTDEDYRKAGMSWAKASYLISLASDVKSKKIVLEELYEMDNDLAKQKLVELKGIGPWSAEMVLMFTLGRPDIFSTGDMGLRNAVSKIYKVDKNDFEKISKITEKWSPYRTLACVYLWESLDNKPQ